jgi:pyrimidine-nucleoside phosphorylase
MIVAGKRAQDVASAREVATETIANGAALQKLAEMVEAQGGDPKTLQDTTRLPMAPVQRVLLAPRDGRVQELDALAVGRAAVAAGAGRGGKEDVIDHGAGIRLHRKVGEQVAIGEPLAIIRASDEGRAESAHELLASAYRIGPEPPSPGPLVLGVVNSSHLVAHG